MNEWIGVSVQSIVAAREDIMNIESCPFPPAWVTLDTSCLNAKARLPEINKLEEFEKKDYVVILHTETTHDELPPGSGPMRSKARTRVSFGGEEATPEDDETKKRLGEVLFPGEENLSINQKRDIEHLFSHQKYTFGQGFFATLDKHFLSKAEGLLAQGIRVGNPEQCLAYVNKHLSRFRHRM